MRDRNRTDYLEFFQEYLDKEKHLSRIVLDRVEIYKDQPVLKHRCYGTWEDISWKSFGENIRASAMGLLSLGISKGDRVAIFSENRPEWHIADLGTMALRGIDVPVYPTNTAKETLYLLNDAGCRVVFVGKQEQYDRIMEIFEDAKTLEYMIIIDRRVEYDRNNSALIFFDDFLEKGRKSGLDADLNKSLEEAHYDDIATIIYTSGTTGEPKGAVITHKNLMHQQWSVGNYMLYDSGEGDLALSFLPLSHVFERSWCYGLFAFGGGIAYCDDHTKILEFLEEAKPTHMNSAPRLYEKMYSTIYGRLETVSKFKQALFLWAVRVGKKYGSRIHEEKRIPLFTRLQYWIADRAVFSKIRGVFGGQARVFTSGGAALSGEIQEFFYNAGVTVLSGYGLTETSPVVVGNKPDRIRFGSNGPLLPLVDGRVDGETGELQFRGPNVMSEYYNKPKETADAFTEDGWFKTGDIGHFDDDGYLYITDRIKDLIITAGGKNIAPQLIETLLAEDYHIEYATAVGEGKKYIAALIVPAFDVLEEYAKKEGIAFTSREDLIARSEIKDFYRKVIDERTRDLGRVEQIKKFTLLAQEFSQEAGEITPTLKLRRRFINEKYHNEIEAMYHEG